MPRMLDYGWRLVFTGVAFFSFSLGGLLLTATVIPALSLLIRRRQRRQNAIRAVIRGCFIFFIGFLKFVRVIDVDVHGGASLGRCRGSVVVANHPTLLDVVMVISLVRRAQCIIKSPIWRSPFLGGVMRAAGYVRNDLEAEEFLAACTESLAAGDNLVIFPEGTRSPPRGPFRFQRSFASIAVIAEVEIQCVLIECDPPTLAKGGRWYEIPWRRAHFIVKEGQRLERGQLTGFRSRAIAARKTTERVEHYYSEMLSLG